MPALSSIRTPIKALILGDSGVGKTGSLWSLAAAGFKLKIFDADRGTGTLAAALENDPKALANIEVNFFTNKLKGNAQGYPIPLGAPKAWPDFLAAFNKWPDGGSIYDWGEDTIVVIDSATILGRHALLHAQHLENKTGKQPEIQHYGTAMAQFEGLMALLYSDDVKCHVLVLTHISYQETELGATFGMPGALGAKLGPIIPRYFNTMVVVKSSGKKRVLSTKPTSMVATKVEQFNSVKAEYLLVDDGVGKPGLAEFFADCGWENPK